MEDSLVLCFEQNTLIEMLEKKWSVSGFFEHTQPTKRRLRKATRSQKLNELVLRVVANYRRPSPTFYDAAVNTSHAKETVQTSLMPIWRKRELVPFWW